MLTYKQKIYYLEKYLDVPEDSYADSFKTDILLFFGDFDTTNPMFQFLNILNSKKEIEAWVNKLTSRIVIKLDEEIDNTGELIADYYLSG